MQIPCIIHVSQTAKSCCLILKQVLKRWIPSCETHNSSWYETMKLKTIYSCNSTNDLRLFWIVRYSIERNIVKNNFMNTSIDISIYISLKIMFFPSENCSGLQLPSWLVVSGCCSLWNASRKQTICHSFNNSYRRCQRYIIYAAIISKALGC